MSPQNQQTISQRLYPAREHSCHLLISLQTQEGRRPEENLSVTTDTMKIAVSSLLLLATLVECGSMTGSNMRIFGIGSSYRTASVDLCNGVNGRDESIYEECNTLVAEEASCQQLHQYALDSQFPSRAVAANHLLDIFHCQPPLSSPVLEEEPEPVCGQSPALRTTELQMGGGVMGRIVGGEETADCSIVPWQVLLTDGRWMCNGPQAFCGGSIISKDYILTAAHCFYGLSTDLKYLNATVGKYRRSAVGAQEKAVMVMNVTVHPSYNRKTHEHDIAILTLKEPLEFNECVSPICLDSTFTPDGHACIVSGWGRISSKGAGSDVLKRVKVETYEGPKCSKQFRIPRSHRIKINKETLLCAGSTKGGADSCEGDSGGPLVCWHNGRYVQTGVVSSGGSCGAPNLPGYYSKVAYYKDWIHSVTGIQS